jgi:hypothetical protein
MRLTQGEDNMKKSETSYPEKVYSLKDNFQKRKIHNFHPW